MLKRARIAAVFATAGLLMLALAPLARTASASNQGISDYAASGFARGAQLAFTFSDSIFPQLLDFDIPFASATADSQAGGGARALASPLYPGNLIASQASGYPGIQESRYPDGESKSADVLPFPPPIGPIHLHAGSMSTSASSDGAQANASAGSVSFSQAGAPSISLASIRTATSIEHDANAITQVVSSTAGGIAIEAGPSVRIDIASITSDARASSDGITASATSRLSLGAVTVTMNGSEYQARIDRTGIHLTGFPSSVPSETSAQLDRTLQQSLGYAGITVRTATPVRIVNAGSAEASVSGLQITSTGLIPFVQAPSAVAEAIATVEAQLPSQARNPICFQQYSQQLPPLCVSPQTLPGPGTGSITTLSLGNVDAVVAAYPLTPAASQSQGGDQTQSPSITTIVRPGSFTPGMSSPGVVVPGSARGSAIEAPRTVATQDLGVVSKLGSGPMAIAGVMLSVLAVLLAIGPSLRRWLLPAST